MKKPPPDSCDAGHKFEIIPFSDVRSSDINYGTFLDVSQIQLKESLFASYDFVNFPETWEYFF